MPEGTEGQQAATQEGQQAQGQQATATGEGQQPPWERDGQTFDPARAWSLIQNLQTERDTLKGKTAETASELEQVRQQAMTAGERAVQAAKAEGRTEASAEFGKRLAASDFATAAARRNPSFEVEKVSALIDLGKFVDAKGEPDRAAIAAAVESLVPAPNGAPSFDGGARTSPPAGGDMNRLIRQSAGRD